VRLDLVPDATQVRFRVREQFAGRSLPNDAVGTTRAVTGAIQLDSQGRIQGEQSKITADLRTLQSDEARRDRFIRENTLETDEFPLAEFSPKEARGLPWPLPTSGEGTFQLDGDLTVHGVTRPTTWETTARFTDQEVSGTASTRVRITEFGMEIPRVTLILSIDDDARLEMDFRATRR
jgi:polyisoprenoid-binding protein YceI